ncbi:MAG TPA: TlyA family RNA methyltransferase [Candidatus Hydrogenedentes bacterium]|nr:TlyA family RNA methyltransferase [Candidatus Hydrogenedentota bacterium]
MPKANKQRLDALVQQRHGITRAKAQALIRAGQVVGPHGERLDKPGLRVLADMEFSIVERPRYVGRGGFKLEAALEAFDMSVAGVVAIDVGASTGGFTDCLLQHGATRVYAVDVGYGQLAWELRNDPRVLVLERTNIRRLTPDHLKERPDFFTVDCSFISLRLVLPPLRKLLAEAAQGIALIKPQFEAGPELVGKGGVVRDERVRERVVEEVLNAASEIGFAADGVIRSPLVGPAGNREFLARLHVT